MNFSLRLLQILLLATTMAVFTAAMTCRKMIWDKDSTGGNAINDDIIMEMGRYMVRTTKAISSAEVQELINTLDGGSTFQYKHKSFTAILQPRDLKKVSQTV